MKKLKEELKYGKKGITLISLVVTIIILLILAGVTIATLTGENGILNQATKAKEETQKASEDELRKLTILEATTHLEEYEYEDPSGAKITIPAKCAVSQIEEENTLADGLVIIDTNGNEWIWIEVPKSIYENTVYNSNGTNKPENAEDYEKIEKVMQKYTEGYRVSGFTDEWYSEDQHGLTKEEYDDLKKNMLKSVYENGGFYIGRYEVGSFDNPVTSSDNTRKPVIQQGAYPYNYVTCSQAQKLSERLAIGGKTSSLIFGIQWDLVLKYLEQNGDWDTINNDVSFYLKERSGSWGNYRNSEFLVPRGNKYVIYVNSSFEGWLIAEDDYNKLLYDTTGDGVLLSTGTTKRNSKMNIYDLAGNLWEWTLEKSLSTNSPCAGRGGAFNTEDSHSVSHFFYSTTSDSGINKGFRPTLW